jgi:hypothetical protein
MVLRGKAPRSSDDRNSMRSTDPKDSNRRFFRSQERIFCTNGQWYFATREGECGPFPSKEIARSEVERYLAERDALRDFERSRREEAREGVLPSELSLALVPLD